MVTYRPSTLEPVRLVETTRCYMGDRAITAPEHYIAVTAPLPLPNDIIEKLRTSILGNNSSAPLSSSASPDGGVVATISELKDHENYTLNAFITNYPNGTSDHVCLKISSQEKCSLICCG